TPAGSADDVRQGGERSIEASQRRSCAIRWRRRDPGGLVGGGYQGAGSAAHRQRICRVEGVLPIDWLGGVGVKEIPGAARRRCFTVDVEEAMKGFVCNCCMRISHCSSTSSTSLNMFVLVGYDCALSPAEGTAGRRSLPGISLYE
ncbi:unnamed protein product, partial [Urochloa humidicola]